MSKISNNELRVITDWLSYHIFNSYWRYLLGYGID